VKNDATIQEIDTKILCHVGSMISIYSFFIELVMVLVVLTQLLVMSNICVFHSTARNARLLFCFIVSHYSTLIKVVS